MISRGRNNQCSCSEGRRMRELTFPSLNLWPYCWFPHSKAVGGCFNENVHDIPGGTWKVRYQGILVGRRDCAENRKENSQRIKTLWLEPQTWGYTRIPWKHCYKHRWLCLTPESLIQQVWGEAGEFTFLTSCKGTLIQPVLQVLTWVLISSCMETSHMGWRLTLITEF